MVTLPVSMPVTREVYPNFVVGALGLVGAGVVVSEDFAVVVVVAVVY